MTSAHEQCDVVVLRRHSHLTGEVDHHSQQLDRLNGWCKYSRNFPISVKAAKLGLVHRPPVVAEISDSSSLLTPSDTYEIGVMCPNMLWPHYDTSTDRLDPDLPPSWVPGIDQVARRHPLVIFDEMHYAAANISDFVKAARNTLVFGFTATPFQLNGRLLENTVKISVFSYQNAMALDGSTMLFLVERDQHLGQSRFMVCRLHDDLAHTTIGGGRQPSGRRGPWL